MLILLARSLIQLIYEKDVFNKESKCKVFGCGNKNASNHDNYWRVITNIRSEG
ncbi:hypothetical protein V12G01_20608 [Vibrio alginolyticus 12G01]|nr:hypothetical protein V12G01_20608 [Vibrio alginolyticus 12G01]